MLLIRIKQEVNLARACGAIATSFFGLTVLLRCWSGGKFGPPFNMLIPARRSRGEQGGSTSAIAGEQSSVRHFEEMRRLQGLGRVKDTLIDPKASRRLNKPLDGGSSIQDNQRASRSLRTASAADIPATIRERRLKRARSSGMVGRSVRPRISVNRKSERDSGHGGPRL